MSAEEEMSVDVLKTDCEFVFSFEVVLVGAFGLVEVVADVFVLPGARGLS